MEAKAEGDRTGLAKWEDTGETKDKAVINAIVKKTEDPSGDTLKQEGPERNWEFKRKITVQIPT